MFSSRQPRRRPWPASLETMVLPGGVGVKDRRDAGRTPGARRPAPATDGARIPGGFQPRASFPRPTVRIGGAGTRPARRRLAVRADATRRLAIEAARVTESTELQDVARAREGDPRAFERLYREHVARIHSLARRMAGPESADDLTQEVFIRAWRKLHTFRGDARFGTWLYRLATNLILSRRTTIRRRQARKVAADERLEGMSGREATPGLAVDFETAIGRLPDGARQVFVLYDVEGYTHGEIAEMMEISTGTSKSQLHRARMLLREELR